MAFDIVCDKVMLHQNRLVLFKMGFVIKLEISR
jgi:hypothetical protein